MGVDASTAATLSSMLASIDRAMWQGHLAPAERHVALGEEHVAPQHEIVARPERGKHDSTAARRFLRQLHELQALHVGHRDRLRKGLGPT